MTMTREEAINRIKDHMVVHHIGEYPHIRLKEALDMSLTALRPVSRERVEKVWPGCPYCKEDGEGYVQKFGAYSIQNGELATGHCKSQKIKFCPHCSRPLTDEAVQMVVERLEALHEADLI